MHHLETTSPAPPKVMLVGMPFMSLDLAPISIGLLQAELRRAGVHCDSTFPGFDLANAIGTQNYEILMQQGVLLGEWVFVEALYGGALVDDELAAFEQVNATWHRWDDGTRSAMRWFRSVCTDFIDWCVEARHWGDYDLVGFSSTFHQNIASLALAKRLKERHPHLEIACGGSNWQAEMGRALHETFPWIDYAAIAEGEGIIADLAWASVGAVDPASIPGICFRRDGRSVETTALSRTVDLDELAIPDYGDWFHERNRSRACVKRPATLVFESSRGCWWGERFHCTFCGLNGESMPSRRKSTDRVLSELHHQRDRFGVNSFMATDTILPIPFFRELLPRLAEVEPKFDLFYEIKANLSAAKVKAMADAGISEVQPGIESLSDHVLQLIRKGTTGIQNIQLLRWCAEFGIDVDWPILAQVPFENDDDYREFLEMAERCLHLPPPGAVQSVEIHRFSPLHETPEDLGYTNVRPNPGYRFLYAVDEATLARIGYTFVGDRTDVDRSTNPSVVIEPIVSRWQTEGGQGGFWLCADGDDAVITDERAGTRGEWRWTGWRAQAIHLCDSVRSRARLGTLLRDVPDQELDDFLADAVERGHLLRSRDRYLTLPVYRPSRSDLAEERRSLMVVERQS